MIEIINDSLDRGLDFDAELPDLEIPKYMQTELEKIDKELDEKPIAVK